MTADAPAGVSAPLTLQGLVYGGSALGRLADGRAVFVPYGLPGDVVRVRLTQARENYALGEIAALEQPGPGRIAARCPHFGECGGCQYQHIGYADQLTAKQAILSEQLTRLGGLSAPAIDVVAAAQPWHYRNHMQFHVASDGSLGLQRAASHRVTRLTTCFLPEPALARVWPRLRVEGEGGERVSLRCGAAGEVLVFIQGRGRRPPRLTGAPPEVESVVYGGPRGTVTLRGPGCVRHEVLGRRFRVAAASFFQVHTAQAEALARYVRALWPAAAGATLLDMYCGVGLFSACLADLAGEMIGIESAPTACDDFEANLAGREGVRLVRRSAEKALSFLETRPEVIVADPPRAGLGKKVVEGISRIGARWLVYVSCDPATLARDGRWLTDAGYQLQRVTLFDLFPQTYHIESVTLWAADGAA